MNEEASGLPSLNFCSNVDGDRMLVIDFDAVDMSEWAVETVGSDGRKSRHGFTHEQLWVSGSHWNYLGIGQSHEAWTVFVGFGSGEVTLIDPSGGAVHIVD